MKKKIYLIDGNSFIYRMFFGLPEFSTKSGEVVNAIFGMAKFFVHQLVRENPEYLIFITDAPGKNFRNDLFEDYKATRDRMPDNLKSQMKEIHNIIKQMGIDIISISGYEADDVIGTLAKKYSGDERYEVDILSGDKDLYSLVSGNVNIYDTMKRKKFGLEETKEKFGVDAKSIIDFLAIVGDKADNIPGIDGFGPKKAVELINTIGGVEEIFIEVRKVESGEKSFSDYPKAIQSCFKGKTFEKLVISEENAVLSKKLATIDLSVSLEDFDLENFIFEEETLVTPEVTELFKKYEFFSLLGETEQKKLKKWEDLNLKVNIVGDDEGLDELEKTIIGYPQGVPLQKEKVGYTPCGYPETKIVLDTETTSLNVIEAELVGVSIYLDDTNIFYINRLHSGPQVGDEKLKEFLKKILELDILIIGHNLKYDLEILELFLQQKNRDAFSHSSAENEEHPQLGLGI